MAIGYGTDKPDFWIGHLSSGVGPNREVHVAFTAPDAERGPAPSTRPRSSWARRSLHEPRLWPEYHERYYGAFVRDPDGNNVEAVCHTGDGG